MIKLFFDNSEIRRQDRLLEIERAEVLLKEAEYGVLSMVDEDGNAYGVPINFVWDGDSSIYFHCAMSGKKIRAISTNQQVSFCIVGNTKPIPEKFTTLYESVIIKGKAKIGLDEREKWHALHLLVKKFSPNEIGSCDEKIEKSLPRTEIIRLDIERISAKAKK